VQGEATAQEAALQSGNSASAADAAGFIEMTAVVNTLVSSASSLGGGIEVTGMNVEPPAPPPPVAAPVDLTETALNSTAQLALLAANPGINNASALSAAIEVSAVNVSGGLTSLGSAIATPTSEPQISLGRGSLGFLAPTLTATSGTLFQLTIGRFDGVFGTVSVAVHTAPHCFLYWL
jgi:hypothetical protein